MKRNTAIIALAACLIACAAGAQDNSYSWRQLKQNGFSSAMQSAVSISAGQPRAQAQSQAQSQAQGYGLPSMISADASSEQAMLPSITSSRSQKQQTRIIKSGAGGSEIYSQEPISLPPVTTLPLPSRTALPPIYSETMMTVPLEDTLSRVLGCNLRGFTGLSHVSSADISKAGSFKMGFHVNWFDLDRIYDTVLATGESGEWLELPLFFNYAVSDDLEVIYCLPIIDYTVKSSILKTTLNSDRSESGTGDSTLGFKYRIFDNKQNQMQGAVGLCFKFPTGNDDKELGTGETDFEIFAAFSKHFEKVVAHLNLGYVMTGDPNTQYYPNGLADKFTYGVGIEYPHTDNVTVMAEVAGEDFGAEGLKVDVIPGLRYTPTENFALEVAVPISVNNDQRYGYNYRVVGGLTTFFQ